MNNLIINIGEKIVLHSGTQNKTFTIIDSGDSTNDLWYKQGASAICFDAMYSDAAGFNHYGKLKKFYLADESRDFETEAEAYISSYKGLHKIVSDNKDLAKIYSFVPEFEIYYDDDKCPYLWTNNVPMRTFEEICGQLLVSDDRTEDALFEIVTTLKSLTDCIRILHENRLIHGDINPSNFGFYMRDSKILADGVSLFDLNTLRYDWQLSKWYTPPYYDEVITDAGRPNHADIKAIGITLCKALGLDDTRIEDIKNARKKFLSERRIRTAVEDIILNADLFKYKGIPSDKDVQEQLIKMVEDTVACNPLKVSISSCTKLRDELQRLETFLLPYCSRNELERGFGIEIVNKALERKDKIQEVFKYLLYERPMYLYEGESDIYRVLLIGFGLDSQSFLDVCLETAQSMDKEIEVDVWGTSRIVSEKEFYFKERPALSQFFLIDNQEELLTGDSYGSIRFHERGKGPLEEQVKAIIDDNNEVNYVYIAAGNDKENSEMARIFSDMLKGKNVPVNSQCEHETKDKDSIHYVCVEDNVKKSKDYEDIERMSFNTHLVWTGSFNADLKRKKEEYLTEYYHASCLSNVLSIKYKLHYFGIELSEDVYSAAKAFKLLSSSAKSKMIAAEHRRWVTEKLCDGWINMRVEDSLQYNDTKDIVGKRHICILRSREEYGLTGRWENHSVWDNADEKSLAELDELDSMSVRLHRAYRRYAGNLTSDYMVEEKTVNDILKESDGMNTVQRIFFEWHECLVSLLNRFVQNENGNDRNEWSIAEFDMLYSRLLEELEKIDHDYKLKKQSLKNKFMSIYNAFLPVSRCLKYHDYKKNDEDLIDNIPFILTYTEDITMVVSMDYNVLASKWDDAKPTELFSYVAAATVANPKELYLPYIASAGEEDDTALLISQKKQSIIDYIKRKGLQTKVNFVCMEGKSDLRKILGIGENIELGGWLLIEDNKLDVVITENIDQISEFSDIYTFDMIKVRFEDADKSDWLNNINRNVGITVRDVAGFLGRRAEIYERPKHRRIKEQPSFHKTDYQCLFDIYSSDRVAWRGICGLLKENKNNDIVRFRKPNDSETKEPKRHIYFMPYTCYKSASLIIQKLKNKKIIQDKSSIDRYSADVCKVTIFENSGCGGELQELFTRQHLLTSEHEYDVDYDVNGEPVLSCEGLVVEGIKYDFHQNGKHKRMLSLLEKLQEAGFIQLKVKEQSFDITYGSWQIKDILMEKGNFLEVYAYYKCKELNIFDDVVTGVKFHRGEAKNEENEMDCFVTKGFQTVIVECKARALRGQKNELVSAKKRLQEKVRKYGINGSGLLVLDSETGIPQVRDYDGVIVCSEFNDIKEIGEVVYRQFKE